MTKMKWFVRSKPSAVAAHPSSDRSGVKVAISGPTIAMSKFDQLAHLEHFHHDGNTCTLRQNSRTPSQSRRRWSGYSIQSCLRSPWRPKLSQLSLNLGHLSRPQCNLMLSFQSNLTYLKSPARWSCQQIKSLSWCWILQSKTKKKHWSRAA